jgi:RimJ/RimL family protein N-acetyltransferase
VAAAIGWARSQGLHKLCLEVFAHNTAAIALYRKCGFLEEGRRAQQYRRANGELWDSIVMGLALKLQSGVHMFPKRHTLAAA